MEKRSKWCSRGNIGLIVELFTAYGIEGLGVALIATGVLLTLIFLPKVPLQSLLLLSLFVGPGAFIGFKRKHPIGVIVGGFMIASWVYIFGIFFGLAHPLFGYPRFIQLDHGVEFICLAIAMAIGLLGLGLSSAFLWLRHRQLSSHRRTYTFGLTLKDDFRGSLAIFVIAYVFIIGPFLCAGVYDYNVRFDTSPPQVISMPIVEKYFDCGDETSTLRLKAIIAPYGYLEFHLSPSESYYNIHRVGDMIKVTIHRGTLGLPWMEGYK